MQEDVTNDRNVSNRRIFKPTNHLYCENTATVDFVAIFFSRWNFQFSTRCTAVFKFCPEPIAEPFCKSQAITDKRPRTPTITAPITEKFPALAGNSEAKTTATLAAASAPSR
jgi:hypothetical protein